MKAFVKLKDGELLIARSTVYGPGYTLHIDDYDLGGLVQDGWQVVSNLDDYISNVPSAIGGPRQVTPLQARLALAQFGMLGQVQSFVAGLPEDDPTRLAWEYASDFREDSQMLTAVCQQLGITDAQKTTLFETALGITV